MPVTPDGYKMDAGSDPRATGSSTTRLGEDLGKGRPTPTHREMPYARHVGIHIIIGEDDVSPYDNSVAAKDDALATWEAWRLEAAHEHYTVQEVRFEFITEGKMALYIIYSE